MYGEVQKENIPRLQLQPLRSGNLPLVLPVRFSDQGSPGETGLGASSPNTELSVATEKKYYFEAVYDFLPTVKGKVSYKRSALENIDPNEKIQVEGLVKTGKDVLIKAGYGNEKAPAGTESKKDTTVWTEFILKF